MLSQDGLLGGADRIRAANIRSGTLSGIDFVVLAYLRLHEDATKRAESNGNAIPEQHALVLSLLRNAAQTMSSDHLFPLESNNLAHFVDSRNRSLVRLQITINQAAARFKALWSRENPSTDEIASEFRSISAEVLYPHYGTFRRMWS